MTEVAADNPHAWFPTAHKGTDLVEPGPDNRMVAFPYTKRLVAMMDVDMAAAVVVASAEAAGRMGVAPEQRVHLRGWATAKDPVYVAEHDDLARSPGMAHALAGALQRAGVGADDLAHADIYSCFPSSVLFALDALGVPTDGPLAPFTVTGGLPYAGGPGSCYSLMSLAAMAERLQADGAGYGLVSGVGMHMTKHAAAVLSASAGDVGPPASDLDPGLDLGLDRRRAIVDVHHGPATVAAYTVHHGPDGEPTDAVLVCDLEPDAGSPRCYAAARDPQLLADLEAEEWVGRQVVLAYGGAGVNLLEGIR
jgi:acetyl-CoA C-acetyltransferase